MATHSVIRCRECGDPLTEKDVNRLTKAEQELLCASCFMEEIIFQDDYGYDSRVDYDGS